MRLVFAWIATAVVVAVVIAIAAGVAYALAWLVVAAIISAALGGVRRANAERGRDGSRSADAGVPHQGFDASTPLGDTDQHAQEPRPETRP